MTDKQSETVKKYLSKASGIAYDGCHKTYLLMDEVQVEYMIDLNAGYVIFTRANTTPAQMLALVHGWWMGSCELRMIDAVTTGGPRGGFESVIAQFEDEEAS